MSTVTKRKLFLFFSLVLSSMCLFGLFSSSSMDLLPYHYNNNKNYVRIWRIRGFIVLMCIFRVVFYTNVRSRTRCMFRVFTLCIYVSRSRQLERFMYAGSVARSLLLRVITQSIASHLHNSRVCFSFNTLLDLAVLDARKFLYSLDVRPRTETDSLIYTHL